MLEDLKWVMAQIFLICLLESPREKQKIVKCVWRHHFCTIFEQRILKLLLLPDIPEYLPAPGQVSSSLRKKSPCASPKGPT